MRHVWPLLLCAGCGEPLTDTAFRGEPLVSVLVEVGPAIELPNDRLRLAVFWGDEASATPGREAVAVALENLPNRASIVVFDPPAAATLGRLILYRDTDGDGAYGPDDVIYGQTTGALAVGDDCPVPIGWRATCGAPCERAPAEVALDPEADHVLRSYCAEMSP